MAEINLLTGVSDSKPIGHLWDDQRRLLADKIQMIWEDVATKLGFSLEAVRHNIVRDRKKETNFNHAFRVIEMCEHITYGKFREVYIDCILPSSILELYVYLKLILVELNVLSITDDISDIYNTPGESVMKPVTKDKFGMTVKQRTDFSSQIAVNWRDICTKLNIHPIEEITTHCKINPPSEVDYAFTFMNIIVGRVDITQERLAQATKDGGMGVVAKEYFL